MHKAALCGTSLFMAGLAESLKACPGIAVIQIDLTGDKLVQCLRDLTPDVIIIEAGALPEGVGFGMLREMQGVLLVELNTERAQLLVLSGKQATVLSARDLIKFVNGQGHASARRQPSP